ncbi:TPA: hypothetical protein ACGIK9_002859 [Acinetobacter baumannii]|uniref:hypothetical protein n=1 Tax=Acinetobacter baumannii TaxID=470 RepID=UPI00338EA1C7
MNKRFSLISVILTISSVTLLSACSKEITPEEAMLEATLKSSQTQKNERTVEWYKKHDFVRNDVIKSCMAIVEASLLDKGIAGEALTKKDYDNPVLKNSDCTNAKQANIELEANLNKDRITYAQYQERLKSFEENNKPSTNLTPEEMAQAKEYMQEVITNMDENEVGKQGDDKFQKLQDALGNGEVNQPSQQN